MYSEQGPAVVGAKAGDRDQRRHVRVEHTGTVEFIGEGRRFSGQAVNISRTGMQVVVNLPDSCASVRSITFRLPSAPGAVDLPCRLVRRHDAPSAEGAAGHVLGVEFSYESEAQMLLIENYVRELREKQLVGSGSGADPRQFGRQVVEHLRQLVLVQMGGPRLADVTEERRSVLIETLQS